MYSIYAVIFGLILLAEKVTVVEGLGIISMITGGVLISISRTPKPDLKPSRFKIGLVYALIGSVTVGFSPILIATGSKRWSRLMLKSG